MARRITDVHVDHEPISAHYELQEFIGEGSFGSVVLGEHMLTKTKVAVKIIKRWGCQKLRKFLLQEVRCLANLHHPNIIQLFHVTISEESLFLIMEFVPTGDLMEYLNDYGSMSEDKARRAFRQLLSEVHYCHSKGIAHRDLKPQNVLLDPAMNAKLIDFGLGAPSNIHRLSLLCGTCSYTAPEVTRDHIYDGCAADIWSLGVVLHETLTNTLPFLGVRMEEVLERLGHGQYDMPGYLSVLARNLLRKMLRPKPAQRKSLRAIMPHPWLNIDEEEELKPYIEPPRGIIDPWVIEKMETMGFHQEDVNDALSKNMYNNTTATYYMLKTQKPTSTHRIIKVKPLYPPQLQSRSPSPAQEFQQQLVDHKPGQKAQESGGGPSHVLEPITEPRAISPSASTEAKTASAERSRGPRTTTFNLPKPRYCWGPRTATPEHRPGSGPGCSLGRRTSTFNLPKLLYCWGSGTTSAEHRLGSGAAPAEHRRGSGTTSPDHSPGSGAATAEHRPGSRAASPEHRPGSRAASPEHRPGSVTATPKHRPGSRAASPEHRPGSRAASPEHRPGSRAASPEHRPDSGATSPEHRPGSRAASPEHRPGSRAASPEHRPGSRAASPEHRPGSKTAIPELNPGSSTSSLSVAPQCHPRDSLSSHSTTSGSARAEENKQGWYRMAVRCLNFFRKIFCLPPKKGHCKTRKAP